MLVFLDAAAMVEASGDAEDGGGLRAHVWARPSALPPLERSKPAWRLTEGAHVHH